MQLKYSFIGSRLVSFAIVFLMSVMIGHAQQRNDSPQNKKLFAEIMHMDSVLFKAFNSRDLDAMKTLFTNDLEWFQDNDGKKITRKP